MIILEINSVSLLLLFQALFLVMILAAAPTTPPPLSLPGCPDHCGELKVPFPFGTTKSCSLEDKFFISCDESSHPPVAYLMGGKIEVTNVTTDGELRILQYVARDCYNSSGGRTTKNSPWIRFSMFTISSTANKFVALGCDTYATVEGYRGDERYRTGCISSCNSVDGISVSSCSGVGCCETSVPGGSLKNLTLELTSYFNHTYVWDFNPCSYAFVMENGNFTFSDSSYDELNDTTRLPMVINWSIGDVPCGQAEGLANYSCKANSKCVNSSSESGYLCECLPGYEGNPYHPHGCQDIDECKDQNSCVNGICQNIDGSFDCTCHKGYVSTDNSTDKYYCAKENKHRESERALIVYVPLGVSIVILALAFLSLMLCWGHKKTKLIRKKEKFFEQNGGLILQRIIFADHQKGSFETAKIFTEEELIRATNNYQQVVGEGGYGIVYKGTLSDNKIVAIKKPKIGAQMQTKQQTEQFINEVILLMQINHRNVVRLLGCCLDTELPILVYEFITNGTLYEHIHKKDSEKLTSLSWELRLKIATEIAGALAYLHFETNTPILHRDIKSMNVLLDENYTAKVSDFGTSRLVPLDQDELSTLVQGTIGYLDPEYLQTSQLTEKSDVYSFGVVLAELLTGKKALSFDKAEGTTSNLALSFLSLRNDNQLRTMIDEGIDDDTNMEAIKEVVNITKRCLRIKGDERPTMKEVAMELEGLRAMSKHPWEKVDPFHVEETQYLLGSPSIDPSYDLEHGSSSSTAVYDSMQSQLILTPCNDGR